MKKIILTVAAATGLSAGAFAQGSLLMDDSVLNPGVSIGVGQTSPSTTAWYTGSVTLQVWYLAGSSSADVTSLNAANGLSTGQGAAYTSLSTLGFTDEATVSETVSGGVFKGGNLALPNIPTSATGTFAIVAFTGSAFANSLDSGLIAFINSTGGNLSATPIPGTPAELTGWNTVNQNLNLVSAVPEPTTMALAGLGGLSLFLLRRKK